MTSTALEGWRRESQRADDGNVLVELRRDDGLLVVIVVSPPGLAPALARTRHGDVSYTKATTAEASEAARVTKAYAQALESGAMRVEFPQGVGRAAAPLAVLTFDARSVAELLAPDVVVGGAPFHGYTLTRLSGEGRCLLEFEGASLGSPAVALSLEQSSSGFRVGDGLGLIVRTVDGAEPPSPVPPEVTRLGLELARLLHEREANRRLQRPSPARPGPSSPRNVASASASLAAHEFALRASGFTVIPNLVSPADLREIADAADRAMEATRRRVAEGGEIPKDLFEHDFYFGARHLHLWSSAALGFLENETAGALARAVIGPHKLFEMVVLTSYPAVHVDWRRAEGWHRDVEPLLGEPFRTRYLWFMLPIDDYRSDNGATWIVPGSHRLDAAEIPRDSADRFPSRVQILAKAGDALVLDPSTLHSRGHNTSNAPRRMLNVMLCHESTQLIENHWRTAGRKVRASASPRVREMLGAETRVPLEGEVPEPQLFYGRRSPAWPALPDDWEE